MPVVWMDREGRAVPEEQAAYGVGWKDGREIWYSPLSDPVAPGVVTWEDLQREDAEEGANEPEKS